MNINIHSISGHQSSGQPRAYYYHAFLAASTCLWHATLFTFSNAHYTPLAQPYYSPFSLKMNCDLASNSEQFTVFNFNCPLASAAIYLHQPNKIRGVSARNQYRSN